MAKSFLNLQPIGFDNFTERLDLHLDDAGLVLDAQAQGAEVVDCEGHYISPGWVDLHVHIWHGGTDISVRAEDCGLKTGVTTLVDAGSAGEASFHGFREYVIERNRERIRAFLNIGSIGLVACNRVPELIDRRFIDLERMRRVIEANRDVICGIKCRASGVIVGEWGVEPLKIARALADEVGLPLMVHIGEAPPKIEEVLEQLRPGDVVTHCFNGKSDSRLDGSAALFEHAKLLQSSGVYMDIGHGAASYDFAVGEAMIKRGFKPDTISTDVHLRNIDGPVFDLATTVSKLMMAGLALEDCVDAIAKTPRRFLQIGATGFEVGAKADYTIFALQDCDTIVRDASGNERFLEKFIVPKWSLLGKNAVQCAKPLGVELS